MIKVKYETEFGIRSTTIDVTKLDKFRFKIISYEIVR